MILSRSGRSRGDETGFEVIGGREAYTVLSQHPAIFWHFCGNFRMSRGALQKMLRRSRYEKRTEQIFCTRSEKWPENRSSRFDPKILFISFSRGSGPPLNGATAILFLEHLSNFRHKKKAFFPRNECISHTEFHLRNGRSL